MDTRFTEPVPLDSKRDVVLWMYPIGTPINTVVDGSATGELDLTRFVTSLRATDSELTASVSWHTELYGANQPKARNVIAAFVDGMPIFVGQIESVNDYRNSVGNRTLSFTVRTRDTMATWREVPRITQEYPQGTNLDVIARDVAESLLTPAEVLLPIMAVSTSHSTTQLAQVSAWQMLEALLLPAGLVPSMDTIGRLGAYSRDIVREADIEIDEERLVAINGGRSLQSITRLQVKWLDPGLTRIEQQDRVVAQANVTAGFFQSHQRQDVWYSSDHTQRVRDARMIVVQSANSGIFNVCDEDFTPVGEIGGAGDLQGRITLTTSGFVPALLALFLATKAAGALPDIAPTFGGPTITVGKQVQAALEFSVLLILASIGTGSYEIWGVPYDFVHARNTTEVYAKDAEYASDKLETIDTDFVMNEAHAQVIAAREFFFKVYGANTYNVRIVDDFRIQKGDIIKLSDGTRLFVTGYQRDLTFGAPAMLDVTGFQVPDPDLLVSEAEA